MTKINFHYYSTLAVILVTATFYSCATVRVGNFKLKYAKGETKEKLHGNSSPQSLNGEANNTNVAAKTTVKFSQEKLNDIKTEVTAHEALKTKTTLPEKSPTKLSKEEKKEIRKYIKEYVKQNKKNDSDINKVLLVILAILLPPLAVALVDGFTGPFWLSILLTLLFYVPGLIYALWRIFKNS